jgi:hypothetical protein
MITDENLLNILINGLNLRIGIEYELTNNLCICLMQHLGVNRLILGRILKKSRICRYRKKTGRDKIYFITIYDHYQGEQLCAALTNQNLFLQQEISILKSLIDQLCKENALYKLILQALQQPMQQELYVVD